MPCMEEQQTRLCIKNILLATDFSESSEATLPYALVSPGGTLQPYS